MKQMKGISGLGKISLITSHSLALILVSWYLLIQIGVVQYDLADMFEAILLLSHPLAGLILIVQIFDQLNQPRWSKLLIWGCAVSSMIAIVSGIAWIQLFLFFSSFSGPPFG